ncbi:hypothetical protein [Catenuloplanes indicus]|uniref:Uncharacterized protein n=1 Tax=Catenuloplanes indicus TaxID=137267 RepID=A0AAE3VZ22_9ACTN|nr:hypothetical protein [Catenuloplanes indicus]MDQ0366838.1 hypothetical protein [Catenuloplanes indicus]
MVDAEVAPPTSREQDAVRVLLIIAAAGTPVTPATATSDAGLADAVSVLETQVKLQKIDFWVRNPDFLALTLLKDFETSREPYLLELADQILASEEPEVRRYPMLRHLFGAYEPLDHALGVLRLAGLVVRRKRGNPGHIQQHDYYLTSRGRAAVDKILLEAPAFTYFVERVNLVAALTEGYGGTQLKARQYLHEEYRDTAIGDRIGSVAARARSRLTELKAEAAGMGSSR